MHTHTHTHTYTHTRVRSLFFHDTTTSSAWMSYPCMCVLIFHTCVFFPLPPHQHQHQHSPFFLSFFLSFFPLVVVGSLTTHAFICTSFITKTLQSLFFSFVLFPFLLVVFSILHALPHHTHIHICTHTHACMHACKRATKEVIQTNTRVQYYYYHDIILAFSLSLSHSVTHSFIPNVVFQVLYVCFMKSSYPLLPPKVFLLSKGRLGSLISIVFLAPYI